MAQSERLICATDALADGGLGVRFEVHRHGESLPAFVVRHGGRVYAYVNECRHQASELDWNQGEFFDVDKLYLICAVHGALYAPETGRCLGGKCQGKGLKSLPVREIEGQIYLEQEDKDG